MLLRLCSGRFYIFTEQMWFKPQVSHWEVMTHISIYCSYCFCSAGFALWYKRIFFDLFRSVKLFYYSWIIAWVSGLPKGLGERRFLMGEGVGERRESFSPSALSLFPFHLSSFPPEMPDTQARFPCNFVWPTHGVVHTFNRHLWVLFTIFILCVSIKFWHKVIVLFFKFWS